MNKLNKPSVLISGTDGGLSTLVEYILESNGFHALLAENAEETLYMAAERRPDLILLDERVPPSGSTEVLASLRRHKSTVTIPVIFVGNVVDPANGDRSGPDGYLAKPISPPDLLDELRQALEKSRSAQTEEVLCTGDLELNPKTYRVYRDGRSIHLAPIEFRLLRHLMQHPEEVFTRDELANAAWRPGVYVGPRTVDVHIGRLRKTLKQPSKPDPIRTVRSVGYSLVE